MLKVKTLVASALVAGSAAMSSHATLIAYEPFSYQVGAQINTLNGGSGNWTNAWNVPEEQSQWVIVGSDYTHPGLSADPAPAGHLTVTGGNRGNTNRSYSTTGATGTVRYIALMIDQGGDMNLFRNGTGSDWGFGLKGGEAVIYPTTAYDNDPSKVVQAGYSNSQPHLLVLRADSSTNTLDLFVNPDLTLSEAANTVDLTAATSDASLSGTVYLASKNLSSNGGWDTIRIADNWTDAVAIPEPASLALLGLGGLMVFGRRRAL